MSTAVQFTELDCVPCIGRQRHAGPPISSLSAQSAYHELLHNVIQYTQPASVWSSQPRPAVAIVTFTTLNNNGHLQVPKFPTRLHTNVCSIIHASPLVHDRAIHPP